jgi:hypothetical protein
MDVRRDLDRGELAAAALGAIALSLVKPESVKVASLDTSILRGLDAVALGSQPEPTASEEALMTLMSTRRSEAPGVRAAFALCLMRAGEADLAAAEVSSLVRDHPDTLNRFSRLSDRAAVEGAVWLVAPTLIGLLDAPTLRARTGRLLLDQLKKAMTDFTPEARRRWLRLDTLSAESQLYLVAGEPPSDEVFDALTRVLRLGDPGQVSTAWKLMVRNDRLLEAATALSPRVDEPGLGSLVDRIEKELMIDVRREVDRGDLAAAALGTIALSLVKPGSAQLAKLDGSILRGVDGVAPGPRPEPTASEEALMNLMSIRRSEAPGARAAFALCLMRSGKADLAAAEVSSLVRDFPDTLKRFSRLSLRASADSAVWLAAPILVGLLDTPTLRARTGKLLVNQFYKTMAAFKQAAHDGRDVTEYARNLLLLDPDYGPAREKLADALAAKGDWQGAVEYWQGGDGDDFDVID